MRLISVTRTPGPKAFKAEFKRPDGRTIIRRFGTGSNYVLNANKTAADRDNYRKRHGAMKAEARALKDPTTPAALSMHLLWGDSRSLRTNIRNFKKKFNV